MALALSSEQLELLHGAADAAPPNWRSRYFAAVLRTPHLVTGKCLRPSIKRDARLRLAHPQKNNGEDLTHPAAQRPNGEHRSIYPKRVN